MAYLYSSSTGTSDDGMVRTFLKSSWADARDGDTGSASLNNSRLTYGVQAYGAVNPRDGSTIYGVSRSFFYFDTSSITSTVSSASIDIRGYITSSGDAIAVKSTAFGGDGGTSLAAGDFDAIVGWSDGSSLAGSATVYGSQITSWSGSGYNDFTGTTDFKNDMKNNDCVIICIMNYTYDYLNSSPGTSGTFATGVYYTEQSGTGSDPRIDYTLATGYGNSVNGVASANIGKINGIATANIEKVNGI